MDGCTCDRHPSAMAKGRVLFPSLNVLYLCGHCLHAFAKSYTGDYHVSYEAMTV